MVRECYCEEVTEDMALLLFIAGETLLWKAESVHILQRDFSACQAVQMLLSAE